MISKIQCSFILSVAENKFAFNVIIVISSRYASPQSHQVNNPITFENELHDGNTCLTKPHPNLIF